MDIVQHLETFSQPKIKYEQYITDAVATADFLFHIAYTHGELENNLIVDLGCGAGNLTIAAALLGGKVIAVDIDPDAIIILEKNIADYDLASQVTILNHDITSSDFPEKILKMRQNIYPELDKIVVISNPPFGVHQKGIDVKFLKQAFQFSDVIYSIHTASPKTQTFLSKKITQLGGVVTERSTLYLYLSHTYKFQKKARKKIKTDVYRIEVRSAKSVQ